MNTACLFLVKLEKENYTRGKMSYRTTADIFLHHLRTHMPWSTLFLLYTNTYYVMDPQVVNLVSWFADYLKPFYGHLYLLIHLQHKCMVQIQCIIFSSPKPFS